MTDKDKIFFRCPSDKQLYNEYVGINKAAQAKISYVYAELCSDTDNYGRYSISTTNRFDSAITMRRNRSKLGKDSFKKSSLTYQSRYAKMIL